MISIQSIGLLLLVSTISVDGKAVATNCGKDSDVFRLTNFKMVPDPVKLPAVTELQLSVDISEDITDLIQTDVTLEKKVLFVWVKAPCENNVGSCSYSSWCELCKTCSCPLKSGSQSMTMTMNMTTAVPTGDYKAKIEFSTKSGQTGCVSITGIEVEK